MLRLPVLRGAVRKNSHIRWKSSSNDIRSTYIEYFVEKHGHKHIKSSSVVPLCDPTVPFVNAGMNQFKGVFLGVVDAPCARAVNSQKCVRVGGKHNDLDLVGTDGHHHTFFEMLGNWSFGDYHKKEACQMAWDLLLGPYRLKPENLLVTYFAGDAVIGLQEDKECRDIWKEIGVPASRIKAHGARDNFWEMGPTGPCGPCTEIHYVHPDGSLTEIWNIVFIQCNREADGKVTGLRKLHVDTGMGLERMAALLQGVPSNYETDLFRPLIDTIHKKSKGVSAYSGSYSADAALDQAYRRLADHARMVSVCLADGVFPSTSLNLKQIMRKSYKISTDVFQNPDLLSILYNEVRNTLGDTYPELVAKEKEAKLIIDHEREGYAKLRTNLRKKWKDLVKGYPEVEAMNDVEIAGFALGYKEMKETMAKLKSKIIPGELVFKLYDTHGFQEDTIQRVARLNNFEIDKKGFWKLLSDHKMRHKTAFKEQTSKKGMLFDKAIEKLHENGIKKTDDSPKYNLEQSKNQITFKPLETKLVALLNEDCEWIDFSEPSENRPYYLVTESTNFYCEEGGQISDEGLAYFSEDIGFKVESVFKIRDIIFHKGYFVMNKNNDENMSEMSLYVNRGQEVTLEIDGVRRLNVMRNHSGVHLLNAAIRKVLRHSVICQVGSSVTDKGLSLSLSVYGEKLSQKVVLEAQEMIREAIKSNAPIVTQILNSTQLSMLMPNVLTVPGETYPESGIRLVSSAPPLISRELCCGTHVPAAGVLGEFCITQVKGAGGNTPVIYALTGEAAAQARELFCRAQKLAEVIELADPERVKDEVSTIKQGLNALTGASGAPSGDYKDCLELLDSLTKKATTNKNDLALQAIAKAEVADACEEARRSGRRFAVHFLRCSYLMQSDTVRAAVGTDQSLPTLLLGCAGGTIVAAARVPQEMVTSSFTAEKWLSCLLPIFHASVLPPSADRSPLTYAEMSDTKVSLINCELLVQDAMRVAIKYAQAHYRHADDADKAAQHN
ncbi:alanine--tRNA ligase, mitochondrial [Maniola jurtina]|uniref:alanine--tRNA ligase, mitochondrial n=1 Tax=Maniola jurtina TaxID=191418 RepID=UPI001E68CA3B|nr:alanine--tRNA ligase, mitochondrial [Maniola jurtina]